MNISFKKSKYYLRSIAINGINSFIDLMDICLHSKRLKQTLSEFNGNKTICFVSDKYMPRIEKLAFGLIQNDYQVVFLCRDAKFFDQGFSLIITYKSSFKVLWLTKQFNPLIYHIFANWNYNTAYSLIKNSSKSNITVFDDYDVLAGMVFKKYTDLKYPDQVKKEKYCLENANGLCCRSIESQFAKRYLGYKYKGKRIFFPEYPWTYSPNEKKSLQKPKTIVYVGGYNSSIKIIAEALDKIGWSIDIFPARILKKDASVYPKNVHIQKSLSHKDLIEALKRYSIAIQFPGMIISGMKKTYTSHKFYYSAAGKIFDYMEAGLHVIMTDGIHQKWILKRYGYAIDVDENNPIENIVEKLTDVNEKELVDSRTNITHLTVNSQTKRLVKFYGNLIQHRI